MLMIAITGYFDGKAFESAAHIWGESQTQTQLIKNFFHTILLFGIGIIAYIGATHFMYKQGLQNSIIMTLIWFVVTISTLLFINGNFSKLVFVDKVIVISTILLVFTLYYRGISE